MYSKVIRYASILLFAAALLLGLWQAVLSSGRQGDVAEVSARVISVENDLEKFGFVQEGTQHVTAEIYEGPLKGRIIQGYNHIQAKLELDHIVQPGDTALFAVKLDANNDITEAYVVDYARHNWEFALFGVFVLTLIFFAGIVGLKALLSFILSILVIWKLLLPGILSGYNPILLTILTVAILSTVIVLLVLGINTKSLTAFGGTMAGLSMTTVFALYFGEHFNLNGATAAFAETFLYAGGYTISLKQLFYAAIILGASGAAVDVAIDIAAAMHEIVLHNPGISRDRLIESGFNVGRAVIGAMTTTLLLAYSGSYIAMLLLFTTKDLSLLRILNMSYIAAEILRTLAGSIGLIMVVPFTAVLGGYLLAPRCRQGE
jgi:uncharacterized membrane protein